MKTSSAKQVIQREYWKKRHIDNPRPDRAKRTLMNLSRCLIENTLHLNVEKRGSYFLCLDCGKRTFHNRPKPKKSMRPRR